MKTSPRSLPALVACASLSLAACGETSTASGDGGGPADGGSADLPEERVACNALRPPVVMAHGFLAAGDTWAPLAQRLASNGDCPSRLFAFDWNPFDRDAAVSALDAFITDVLAESGASQVQLVGHSAGGVLGYTFLADPARAARVSHYVHVGSAPEPLDGVPPGPAGPPEAPVPTLNLWSTGDTVLPGADMAGCTNVRLDGQDHYEVATSEASFSAIHAHLRGGPPQTVARGASPYTLPGPRYVRGKALRLGDNAPAAGWQLTVHAVDPDSGAALGEAVATATVADDGGFGPFQLASDTPHVFHLTGPGPDDRAVRYYREPFAADDAFVYLRVLPAADSFLGLLFGSVPFSANSPLLIAFSSSRAVIAGRDSLVVDGEELAVPAFAAADKTSIAWFLYDDEDDGQPGASVGSFSALPSFLAAIDRVYPVASPGPLTLALNGRTVNVPRWPAATEGATVVIFD
jgi:pimeloyl-ACP methyl ester carboxylesterase